MFALHSISIIFHQKPEATASTAKGGGSTFNGIYSPPPPPPPENFSDKSYSFNF